MDASSVRLGPFEVPSLIGARGMGLPRPDTRFQRDRRHEGAQQAARQPARHRPDRPHRFAHEARAIRPMRGLLDASSASRGCPARHRRRSVPDGIAPDRTVIRNSSRGHARVVSRRPPIEEPANAIGQPSAVFLGIEPTLPWAVADNRRLRSA